jgi:uncharacterized membrane protein YesL
MQSKTIKDIFKLFIDIFYVNLLFWCTLIIGLGLTTVASFKAMFYVLFHLHDPKHQTYVAREYFESFKENFMTSLWMSVVLIGVALLYYVLFRYAFTNVITVLMAFSIASAFLFVSYLLYLLPIYAIFQTESNKKLFQNSFFLFAGHPWVTFKLIGSLAFVVLLFELFSGTILFSVALVCYINTIHLDPIFKPYYPVPIEEESI